jgi:hypothetical protein
MLFRPNIFGLKDSEDLATVFIVEKVEQSCATILKGVWNKTDQNMIPDTLMRFYSLSSCEKKREHSLKTAGPLISLRIRFLISKSNSSSLPKLANKFAAFIE